MKNMKHMEQFIDNMKVRSHATPKTYKYNAMDITCIGFIHGIVSYVIKFVSKIRGNLYQVQKCIWEIRKLFLNR